MVPVDLDEKVRPVHLYRRAWLPARRFMVPPGTGGEPVGRPASGRLGHDDPTGTGPAPQIRRGGPRLDLAPGFPPVGTRGCARRCCSLTMGCHGGRGLDGEPSSVSDGRRKTGAGKGRPAGMAILDPEIRRIGLEPDPPVRERMRPPDGLGEHAIAVARVRRHAARRLLYADVVGLVVAAIAGPLLVSAVSNNPASTVNHNGRIYLFNLVVIPLFIGGFALYGLYRGITRRISMSVFSDLRNIVHALMISGFLYAIVDYLLNRSSNYMEALSVAKIVAMCGVAVVTVPLARAVAFGFSGRASAGSVPVIVVGTGKLAQTVASHLRAHSNVQFV